MVNWLMIILKNNHSNKLLSSARVQIALKRFVTKISGVSLFDPPLQKHLRMFTVISNAVSCTPVDRVEMVVSVGILFVVSVSDDEDELLDEVVLSEL